MSEFKREERFIVIKRKNLRPIDERELHTWLQQNEIPTCECVVVESDWPEYEQVWGMIEARVTGAQSALAAKDARIAELEAERDAWVERATSLQEKLDVAATPSEDGGDMVDRNDLACDRAYRNGLMAGFNYGINGDEEGYNRSFNAYQQGIHEASAELRAKADIHPKNGMEVPKVVAVQYEDGTVLTAADCGSTLEICAKVQTPLMTVAQHSRIVAAKDADIRHHIRVQQDMVMDIVAVGEALGIPGEDQEGGVGEFIELIEALRAQPARQVGGDERVLRQLLGSVLCYVERDIERMRGDREKADDKVIYDRSIAQAEERLKAAMHAVFTTEPGCATGASLAPAAVVMPERRTDANYPTQLWREAAGWNAALDKVARLNRNAMPVELLKSLSKSACKLINEVREFNVSGVYFTEIGDNLQYLMALELENDELRALLGKE